MLFRFLTTRRWFTVKPRTARRHLNIFDKLSPEKDKIELAIESLEKKLREAGHEIPSLSELEPPTEFQSEFEALKRRESSIFSKTVPEMPSELENELFGPAAFLKPAAISPLDPEKLEFWDEFNNEYVRNLIKAANVPKEHLKLFSQRMVEIDRAQNASEVDRTQFPKIAQALAAAGDPKESPVRRQMKEANRRARFERELLRRFDIDCRKEVPFDVENTRRHLVADLKRHLRVEKANTDLPKSLRASFLKPGRAEADGSDNDAAFRKEADVEQLFSDEGGKERLQVTVAPPDGEGESAGRFYGLDYDANVDRKLYREAMERDGMAVLAGAARDTKEENVASHFDFLYKKIHSEGIPLARAYFDCSVDLVKKLSPEFNTPGQLKVILNAMVAPLSRMETIAFEYMPQVANRQNSGKSAKSARKSAENAEKEVTRHDFGAEMAEFRVANVGKANLAAAQAFKTQQDRIKAEQGLGSASEAEDAKAPRYDVDFVQFKEYGLRLGEGRAEDVGYNFFNDFMLCLDSVEVGYLELALIDYLLFGSRRVAEMAAAVGGYVDGVIETTQKNRNSASKKSPLPNFIEAGVVRLEHLQNALKAIQTDLEKIDATLSAANESFGCDAEKMVDNIVRSITPLRFLARKMFDEAREIFWSLCDEQGRGIPDLKCSELETRFSRIIEQRNIAVAKWNMRKQALGVNKARDLAQRECVNLGPLQTELYFAVPPEIYRALAAPADSASATPPAPSEVARFYPSGEAYPDIARMRSEGFGKIPFKTASLSDYLLAAFSDAEGARLKRRYSPEQLKMATTVLTNSRRPELAGEHAGAWAQTVNKFDAGRLEAALGIFAAELKREVAALAGGAVAPESVVLGDLRWTDGPDDAFELKAPRYRLFYPQRHAPARDVPIDVEDDEKLKKYISITFSIDHENEEALLRNFFQNWVSSRNFQNLKLLALAKEIHFCDRDRPYELSEFTWHQMPMEKYPDLMPWVDAETKTWLGVDDESRFKDDPVELVEDDAFSDYWHDVGTGMVPPEKGARCDLHLQTNNEFTMDECATVLLKHTRSVFCYRRKMPLTRKKYVMLKSAHVHGKSADRFEEIAFHHVYTFVVPDSQRGIMERMAQEVIAPGSAAKLVWEEEAD